MSILADHGTTRKEAEVVDVSLTLNRQPAQGQIDHHAKRKLGLIFSDL